MKGIRILIIMIVVAVFFCGVLPNLLVNVANIPPAALPIIQLPAENLVEEPLIDFAGEFNDFYLTNTLVATILTDLVIVLIVLFAGRNLKEVPKGMQNLIETLVEGLYNFSQQIAGNLAKEIFPLFAAIFLFLLVANWMELIPGVDSIGILHHAHGEIAGHPKSEVGSTGIYYLDVDPENTSGVVAEEGEHEADLYVVTPFVRAAATDLNLTLGLAIISVIWIQVYGIRKLGIGYFSKFINTPGLARGGFGYIDFGVGLLEIISEVAKIVSFAFRLLGNIFAGQLLLFIAAFLVPYLVPLPVYGLELFVGAIQAFVFAVLTLVFMSGAAVSHHPDEEHH